MAIPNAVKKQAARSEQLMKEHKEKGNTGTPAPAPADTAASPSPAPAPAAPAVAAPPPVPSAPPATPPPAPPPADDWEQKYKVLQGKYNAEVPSLQGKVNEMHGTVQKLQKDLETAKAAPPPAPQPPFEPGKYVKKEDIEEYTPEMTDFIRNVAREVQEANLTAVLEKLLPTLLEPYLGKTIKPLQDKVEMVATHVEKREAREHKSDRERFFDALDQSILDKTKLTFDAINTNTVFLNWLMQKDPRSRRVRQELLDESVAALDAEWAASFYTDFVTEHPTAVTAPTSPTVVPERAGGGEQPRPAGKIWKRSEISAFYNDVTLKKYAGRDAERQQTEKDIYAAQREGRVVEG